MFDVWKAASSRKWHSITLAGDVVMISGVQVVLNASPDGSGDYNGSRAVLQGMHTLFNSGAPRKLGAFFVSRESPMDSFNVETSV
jgi:hypothetical protein